MPNSRWLLVLITVALAAFSAGRWSRFSESVKADSAETPQVEIRQVAGDSSLIVYYPSLKRIFVYQNPFVGLPTWPCAYSVQLGTPGGTVSRQPCTADR
jgi:hypothetical protein